MTTPEQDEPQRLNEPEHLEAEGYLVRALRRLGEGLGPYVYGKIQDAQLLKDGSVTRDVQPILRIMVAGGNWTTYFQELGHYGRSWVSELIEFRNGPWAHLVGYSDDDVLHYLGVIGRLLKAVSADEQARVVDQMWGQLGKLLFNQSTPQRPRDSESDELRQRISEEVKKQLSELMAQQEGKSAPSTEGDDKAVHDFFSGEIRLGLSEEEYSQAIAEVDEILRLDPTNVSAYIDRAKIHGDKLEFGLAIDDYSEALKLDPGNAAAYIERGNLLCGPIGDIDWAIDDYTAALHLNQDDKHTYVRRALAYSGKGKHDWAIKDYDAALQLDSQGEYEIYILRARAYAHKWEYDSAIADYSAAIRLNPNDEVLYIIRGNAYRYGKEDYDRAISDYSTALKIRQDCELAHVERGKAYAKKGEWALAIDDYGAALECFKLGVGGWEDPINDYCTSIGHFTFFVLDIYKGEAYFNRANAHFERGEYNSAISDLTAVLKLDPSEHGHVHEANVYYARGGVYANKREYDHAIADIEKAIELTRNGEFAEQLGKVRDEIIHLRDKTTEYDRHIDENPDDPQVWHLRGVHCLYDREDYGLAVDDFSEAIRLDADNAEVWKDRGLAHYQQSENDLAYDDFSRAIELKPDLAEAWYYRAWVWRRGGDPRRAIEDFDQAIAIRPDYAAAYQHRGISYFDLVRREQAQADFEMARSLGFNP